MPLHTSWPRPSLARPRAVPEGREDVSIVAQRSQLVAVAALIVGFWIASEFSRTYLATRENTTPVGVTDVRAGTPLAAQRFLAYVITSTNNGMYAVDHLESRAVRLQQHVGHLHGPRLG